MPLTRFWDPAKLITSKPIAANYLLQTVISRITELMQVEFGTD